jgi:hypothetical protein
MIMNYHPLKASTKLVFASANHRNFVTYPHLKVEASTQLPALALSELEAVSAQELGC